MSDTKEPSKDNCKIQYNHLQGSNHSEGGYCKLSMRKSQA